ncbi:MAG: PIN domain-containing protein [Acidimicrobiales bacterium]
MKRIGVRELRQNASQYLALVKAGQTVEVSERGTLVALLVPPQRSQSTRDRLIAAGRLHPSVEPDGASPLTPARAYSRRRASQRAAARRRARGTTVIYLDSSALMKLIREEKETAALREWLIPQPELPVVTSELGRLEVLRAAPRAGDEVLTEARVMIGDVDLVPLDRGVQDLACEIGDPPLRTLDALHLASALLLRDDLTAFVAYDHRLMSAARAAELPTTAPGRPEPPDVTEPGSQPQG